MTMNGTLFSNPLRCKFYHAIPESSRDFIKLQNARQRHYRCEVRQKFEYDFGSGGKGVTLRDHAIEKHT
jgi:hypothetical protein